jgi:hypothetical protein
MFTALAAVVQYIIAGRIVLDYGVYFATVGVVSSVLGQTHADVVHSQVQKTKSARVHHGFHHLSLDRVALHQWLANYHHAVPGWGFHGIPRLVLILVNKIAQFN